MPEELLNIIPPDVLKFLLVLLFSLLIGLEQRRYHLNEEPESRFGTDRTFTLIGILGFILYLINPQNLIPFLGGGAVIGVMLSVYYREKIKTKEFGITSLVIALITYCLAPLIYTQSNWLVILIVVSVLILTEIKKPLLEFSKKFDYNEFTTLAKFLVIAGVILPLLPDKPVSAVINITPYKFWLAVVAVSGISYFSYLLKKFVFPKSGIILTGILGGMYSSTATTMILARRSREMPGENRIAAAVILATAMMYIRIFLLALFFNITLAFEIAPYFAVLVAISSILGLYFYRSDKSAESISDQLNSESIHTNPLEFKTALLFGSLFILFAFLTGFVSDYYGAGGIKVLSFVVGVTDIDPFIINLLQSKFNLENTFIVMAVVNATTSNNFLKMIYGITLSKKSLRRPVIAGFSILIAAGLILSFVFI
ncbi:MAG: DUF4010 domain-containing protein [Bacteroidetes bacterium]|nr:DUF4010 domain-containing protein [Bacteroidota bacterium]